MKNPQNKFASILFVSALALMFGVNAALAQPAAPSPAPAPAPVQSPRPPRASITCAAATPAANAICATACPTTCAEQGTTWGGGTWGCDSTYAPVCSPVPGGFACSFRCALTTPTPDAGGGATTPAPSTGGSSIQLSNPLGTTSLHVIIGRVIKGVLGIVGSIALLMFVYGGIRWIAAGGGEENVKAAQKVLTNATIGLLIIFFSYTIVSAFLSLFS